MPALTPELLVRAYAMGVFPMAQSARHRDVHWVDPQRRGILPLDRFHIPHRLRRTVRSGHFEITCDSAFEAVMRACAEPTPDRPSTWINEAILQVYTGLFRKGLAHSVEAWSDGELAGGLYGVSLNGAFFGESMFSRATDASKVALVHLAARLVRGGYSLLDAQFLTTHLVQFGAVEIPRAEYHRRLASALTQKASFQPLLGEDPVSVLQSSSQTS